MVWLLALSVVTVLQANAAPATPTLIWWTHLTWYDDNVEVVDKLNFVQSWNQSDTWMVGAMYAEGENTLVVTSNSVVAESSAGEDSNELVSDVKSQIIWWAWIRIWSHNITIIWWNRIVVEWWNDNATILWGKNNTLSWNDWIPAVLVGGAGNEISNTQWGAAIVGWSWNKIIGWLNSQILWWEGNSVEANNALVAWSNVSNAWADNSFVFSDSSFTPESSGAFYLNTEFGLWLNANSSSWGITSAWWISVWAIDIEVNSCNEDNIWVQWVYNGCLMWCTTWSSVDGKWDLLETSTTCMEWCDGDDKCVDTIKTIYESFTGFCNLDSLWVLRDRVSSCWDLHSAEYISAWAIRRDSFKDVIFDVNFVTECPSGDTIHLLSNPCTYVCPEWYSIWSGMCYQDCELPWDATTKVHYWTIVTGYTQNLAQCASWQTCNDFRGEIKCGADSTGNAHWDVVAGNVGFTNAADLKNFCSLDAGVACPSDFNLTSTWIVGWIYSGCTEYATVWNTQCNASTKYKFIGCASWYSLINNQCIPDCINPFDWTVVPYGHSITWYATGWISCSPYGVETSCMAAVQTLTCWVNWEEQISSYPYSWCKVLEVNAVSTEFNLTECPKAREASWTKAPGIAEGASIWYCTIKTWYRVSDDGQRCELYHMYRLDWCIPWYHTWSTTTTKYKCLPDCIVPWSTWNLQYNVNSALWWRDSIVWWSEIKWYKTNEQTCPEVKIWSSTYGVNNWWLNWCENSNNWANMKCLDNGVLSWKTTYTLEKCDTKPLLNKTWFNRTSPVDNAVCEEFQPYSVTVWNTCTGDHKTYRCTRCDTWYTLNGKDLTGWDVNARCLKDCTFDISPSGTKTLSWWTGSVTSKVAVYDAASYICPTAYTNHTEVWSCDNGTISRSDNLIPLSSKPYLSYVQTAVRYSPAEINNGTQTWVRTITKNWDIAHGIANAVSVTSGASAISGRNNPYKYYLTWTNPACSLNKTYYYLKCDISNWYVWATNSDNCVRCDWSIPSNGVKNNNNYPTTSSITYCYSEDTSTTCSFRCQDWEHWVASSTGDYYKCWTSERWNCVDWYCALDWGEKKLHNSTFTIYRWSSNPICNNVCDGVSATCLYGEWRVGGVAVTWNVYSGCSTRNGYVITDPSQQVPSAGSYNPSLSTNQKKLTSWPTNAQLKEKATEYSASNKTCTTGTTYFKVECSGNYYWSGNLCQKYCVWLNGNKYTEWQTMTWYTSTSSSCPTSCTSLVATATCKSDWTWSRTLSNSCSSNSYICNGYTLTSCPSTCNCDSCVPYSWNSNGSCTKKSTWYKITSAKANYYVNGSTCSAVCAPSSATPCNGGYSKSGTTWNGSYTCTSGSTTVTCNCPWSQVWNGSRCVDWWASCGTASWTTVSSKPSTASQKCSAWTASDVATNDSTYTWTCTNVSQTVDCLAYRYPSCGSAHGQDYCEGEPPTSNLCSIWTSNWATIDDRFPWKYSWTCTNGSKTTSADECFGVIIDCQEHPWVCGTANWSYYNSGSTLSSNLCSVWTKTAWVTSTTTWYKWTCTEDTSVDCSAYKNAECGSANWKTTSSAPSSNLCSVWSKSSWVTTNTSTYTWTCKNYSSTVNCTGYQQSIVAWVCGSADWSYYNSGSTPSSNLCSVWTKTAWVTSTTTWYKWTCTEDTSVDCSAYKNAECGSANWKTTSSAPSSNLCSVWSKSSWVTTNTSTYTWTCKNYSSTVNCTGYQESIVAWVCGSASWKYYSSRPTTNLCSVWSSTGATTGTYKYTWTCTEDASVSCEAYRSPTCGSAEWWTFSSAPSSNLCSVWTGGTVSTYDTYYEWRCWVYWESDECQANVSVPWKCTTKDNVQINDSVTFTSYTTWSAQCPSTCSTQQVTCSDWTFYKKWTSTVVTDVYYYGKTTDERCVWYPLSSCPSNCNCVGAAGVCTLYSWSNSNTCTNKGTRYQITSAKANYYIDGNTCSAVCAPSSTTPCNGGYTATGTKRGDSYTCKKSGYSDVSCNCDEQIWNGSRCTDSPDTLCIETSIDGGCNSSIMSNFVRHDNTWSTWKCKNAVAEGNCHYCPDGWERSDADGECIDGNSSINPCVGYPLTTCPAHGACSVCPSDSSKKRLDSCQPTNLSQYCSTCPSNVWLGACPPNANCQQADLYAMSGENSCYIHATHYRFLSCKSWYVVQDEEHPYSCVLESDPCVDYPLTTCPANAACATCPSNSSRKKFLGCHPNWDDFGWQDGARISWWCPEGAICSPAWVSIYTATTSQTCSESKNWYKVTGCRDSCGSDFTSTSCPSGSACDSCEWYNLALGWHSCSKGTKYAVRLSCVGGGIDEQQGCQYYDWTYFTPTWWATLQNGVYYWTCSYWGYRVNCSAIRDVAERFCHTYNWPQVPYCASVYASYPGDTNWLYNYCFSQSELDCSKRWVLHIVDTNLWTSNRDITLPYTVNSFYGHTETAYNCCEFW